ncbi:PH domain-containing protein [Amycolatopsis minnesotensis]|uniref:PH domain-containing protein n=1 Tax=Amycolatopsis minnesotensis TaxID=337894 RepID=A0ABN2QCB6_9PSEU
MAKKAQQEQQDQGRKAIFRIPATAILAIVVLVVCVTPVAFGGIPGLQALYLVPLGLLWFVQRMRTVATPGGLAVRTMFGHRDLPWTALKGLSITSKARVRAVLDDGSEVALPAVRTRHLPVLSLVSGGLLKDPTGLTDDETGPSESDTTAPGEEAAATAGKDEAETISTESAAEGAPHKE